MPTPTFNIDDRLFQRHSPETRKDWDFKFLHQVNTDFTALACENIPTSTSERQYISRDLLGRTRLGGKYYDIPIKNPSAARKTPNRSEQDSNFISEVDDEVTIYFDKQGITWKE